MATCSVSNLPVTERPHWKTVHSDEKYTTHLKRIGDDILLTYYEADRDITIEYMDKELYQTVLDESGLTKKPVYLLRDLTHVTDVSYAYKVNLTQLIYHWRPYFRLIVFYNIPDGFSTTVETFAAIVPENTPVLLVDSYTDAVQAVLDMKEDSLPAEEYDDEEVELYSQRKKDFLAATARIGWMNMLSQAINIPPEDDYLHPFFKALDSLQKDLQEREKIRSQERVEIEKNCEKKVSEQIILLNAQLELNNKLATQFDRERSALKSRIAAQDMELTRVSTAIAEKASVLQLLKEKIEHIDMEPALRNEMTSACDRLIETEMIEKKINTELTANDSDFLSKLQQKHPNLNQRDLRICLLIKLNYDTREIARSIGISTRGLESIRYRMHKKMELSKHQSIKNYLTQLAVAWQGETTEPTPPGKDKK